MKSNVLFNRCFNITKISAVLTIFLGGLVLLGWVLDIDFLKSIMPDWATMKPTTAIGFIFLACCILLIQFKHKIPYLNLYLLPLLATLIILFSGLTLLEFLLKLEFGIDNRIFKEVKSAVTPYPGRMSFLTAVNFLLAGLAIMYLHLFKNKTAWPAHILALIICLASVDAIFGFAYGIESFYDAINYTQLSLHGSIVFIIISISLLFVEPKSGFTKIFILDDVGSSLAWKLLPSILVVPPIIGGFAYAGDRIGLYETEFQVIIVVMSFFIIFTSLVWRVAYSLHIAEKQYLLVSKKLQKIHVKNQELIDTKQYLEQVSSKDGLTGLANRSHFHGLLEHAMLRAKRYKSLLALFFIDLDNFKSVNDQFGHEVGDKLLIGFAERLKRVLREMDTISRLGGDEFTVIIEDPLEIENIHMVANRIVESLKEPFFIDKHIINITISVGISTYPKDGLEVDTLIKNADIAMYQAKRTGKNNYQFYQSDLRF